MIFYLVLGGLFTLYAVDLLLLVIVSAVARVREVRELSKKNKAQGKQKKKSKGDEQQPDGQQGQQKEGYEAGGPAKASPQQPAVVVHKGEAEAAAVTKSVNLNPLKIPAAGLDRDSTTNPHNLAPAGEVADGAAGAGAGAGAGGDSHSSTCSFPSTPHPPAPALVHRAGSHPSCMDADGASNRDACSSPDPAGFSPTGDSSSEGAGAAAAGTSGPIVNNPLTAAAGDASRGRGSGVERTRSNATSEIEEMGEQQQEDSSPSAPPLPSEAQLPGPFPLGPQHGRSTSASSSVAGSAGAATIASAPALAHSLPAAAAAAGIMQAGPGVAVLAPPQGQGPPPRRLHSSGGSGLSLGSSMGSTSLASSTSMGSADIAVAAELVKAPVNAWSTPVKGGGLALQPSGSSLGSELEAAAAAGGFVVGKAWAKPASDYPLVLIQLPMFNEEAHCDLVIYRCCEISWPRSRLLIQVLDDSTKAHVRDKVDAAAAACVEAGHPVQVMRRTNRQGFKAGAMVDGLDAVKVFGFKYVAIFDADFDPPKDFLEETIAPLEADPKMAFVQTRWLCPSSSFLTWAQKINLGFHFDVEQRARSFLGWFFNFNGTAGVWRIAAIEDAGGWQSDTVVEDMDLSLRAYLAGWKAIYLPHVGCLNEVPDTLATYKTQQFRWLSGPMQILVKAFHTILTSPGIGLRQRINCYWFFARYILFAAVTLGVLAVPPVAMWLDPWKWEWPQIFFCITVNFAFLVYLYITPFSIAYLLFSVAVGYFKAWAMLGGLVGTKKSKSWKVTAKKGLPSPAAPAKPATGGGAAAPGAPGGSPGQPTATPAQAQQQQQQQQAAEAMKDDGRRLCCISWRSLKAAVGNIHRPYALEAILALYYGGLAAVIFWQRSWLMGAYCTIMAIVFLALSFGDAYL